MEYTHTYHVGGSSGVELELQDIERTEMNYDRERSRLKITGEDTEFALAVLMLNNPEIKFTRLDKNGN